MSSCFFFVLPERNWACVLCDVIYNIPDDYDDALFTFNDLYAPVVCLNCMAKHWNKEDLSTDVYICAT